MNKIKLRNFEIIKSNIPKSSEFKFYKPFQEIQSRNVLNEKELNEETFKTRQRRKPHRTKKSSNLKIRKKSFGDSKQFFSPRLYQSNNFGNLHIHRKKHRINQAKAEKSKKLNYLKLAKKNNYLSSSKKLAKYLYKNSLYSSSKISNSIEATLFCTKKKHLESEKKICLKKPHIQNFKIPPYSCSKSLECNKCSGNIIGNDNDNNILESQFLSNNLTSVIYSKNSKVDWEGVFRDLPHIVPKLLNSKNITNTLPNRDLHSRSVDKNSKVAQKNSLNLKLTKIKEANNLKTEVKNLNNAKPAEKKCFSENDVRRPSLDENKIKIRKIISNNTVAKIQESTSQKLPKDATPIKKISRVNYNQKKIIETNTQPKLPTIQDKSKLMLKKQTDARKTIKKDSTSAKLTDVVKSYNRDKNITKSAPVSAKTEKKENPKKNSTASRFRAFKSNKPSNDLIKTSSKYNGDQKKLIHNNPPENPVKKLINGKAICNNPPKKSIQNNPPEGPVKKLIEVNVIPEEKKLALETKQFNSKSLHLINGKVICNEPPKKSIQNNPPESSVKKLIEVNEMPKEKKVPFETKQFNSKSLHLINGKVICNDPPKKSIQNNPLESPVKKLIEVNIIPEEKKVAFETKQLNSKSLHLINEKNICNNPPKKSIQNNPPESPVKKLIEVNVVPEEKEMAFEIKQLNSKSLHLINGKAVYNDPPKKSIQNNRPESPVKKLIEVNEMPEEKKLALKTKQLNSKSLQLINEKVIGNIPPEKTISLAKIDNVKKTLTKLDFEIYALKLMEKATRKKIDTARTKMKNHDENDSEAKKTNLTNTHKIKLPHKLVQRVDTETNIKENNSVKRSKVETIPPKQTKSSSLRKDENQTTKNLRNLSILGSEKESNFIAKKFKESKPQYNTLNNYRGEKNKTSGPIPQGKLNLRRSVDIGIPNKNNEQNQNINIYVKSIPSLKLKKPEQKRNQMLKNIEKKYKPLLSTENSINSNLESSLPLEETRNKNQNNKLAAEITKNFTTKNRNKVQILFSRIDNKLNFPKPCVDSKCNDRIERDKNLTENSFMDENTESSEDDKNVEACKNKRANNEDEKLSSGSYDSLFKTNRTILEIRTSYSEQKEKFPIKNVINVTNYNTEPAKKKKIIPDVYSESIININYNFDTDKKNNNFLKDNDHGTNDKEKFLYMIDDTTNTASKKSVEINNSYSKIDPGPPCSALAKETTSVTRIESKVKATCIADDSNKKDVSASREIDVPISTKEQRIWVYEHKVKNSDLKFKIVDIKSSQNLNNAPKYLDGQSNCLKIEADVKPESLESLIGNTTPSSNQELNKELTIKEMHNTENQVINTVFELQKNFCEKKFRPNIFKKILNSKPLGENHRISSESIIDMPQLRTLSESQISSLKRAKYYVNETKLRNERMKFYKEKPEDLINQYYSFEKNDATSQTSNTHISAWTTAKFTQYDLNQQIPTDCDLFSISDTDENFQNFDSEYYSDTSTSVNYENSARSQQSEDVDNVIECFEESDTFNQELVPAFKGCECMKSKYERLYRIAYGNS